MFNHHHSLHQQVDRVY